MSTKHGHQIIDADAHFTVDPISRVITNDDPKKNTIIQGDHNSERFTFKTPRHIDGHDMLTCDNVRVAYINTEVAGRNKQHATGVYLVSDLALDPSNDKYVTCSWLISKNATEYFGVLNFMLIFSCMDGELVKYRWKTNVFESINVAPSLDSDLIFEAEYLDVIEQWKDSVKEEFSVNFEESAKHHYGEFKEVLRDEMATEFDAMQENLDEKTNTMDGEIDTLKARMDTFTSLPDGSTTGDAELADIRVGVNGGTYDSAGSAVRAQIGDIQTNLSYVHKSYINWFNADDPNIVNGSAILENGSFLEISSAFTTGYIPVTYNKTYMYNKSSALYGGSVQNVCCFDADKECLGKRAGEYNEDTQTLTFRVTDKNVHYIRTSWTLGDIDTFMVCEGDEYPPFYVNYGRVDIIPDDVICSADKVKKPLGVTDVNFVEVGRNLFNMKDVTNGYYIMANGTVQAASGYGYSQHIAVESSTRYAVTESRAITSAVIGEAYDKHMSRIGNLTGTLSDDGRYYTFVTPEQCVYIRINFWNSDLAEYMLCKGSYPDEYIPYSVTLSDNFGFNQTQKREVKPLYKKSVSFNGDSVCAGAGFRGGYGLIISKQFDMDYENLAVGGGTLIGGSYSSSGELRHSISRTIDSMNVDSDYIIIEGGVNDAALGVPLGSVSTGYNAELNDTTFCGAMESICKQLVTNFPGKKVGFIIVHKMLDRYSTECTSDKDYYATQVRICEKWGVPYLDLNKLCPPFVHIKSLADKYTLDGDGWHPNEEGYRLYYVPKIVSWMESL